MSSRFLARPADIALNLGIALALACPAAAQVPALDIVVPSPVGAVPAATYSIGFEFTPKLNVNVSALGAFNFVGTYSVGIGSGSQSDGLYGPVNVSLWTDAGQLLVNEVVHPTDPLTDDFRYAACPDTILLAGHSYILSQSDGVINLFSDKPADVTSGEGASGISVGQYHPDREISIVTSRYTSTLYTGTQPTAPAFPTSYGQLFTGSGQPFGQELNFGPNFRFVPTYAPEPSAFGSLLVEMLGLGALCWKARRRTQ